MDEYDEAVLFTYGLLESRLERLEYLLSGPKKQADEKPQTIPDRIHRIEQSLQQLAGKTALLDNVNELLTKHKDVLTPPPSTAQDTVPLSTSQKSLLVIERATSFATTASQLKALEDQPIPTTDGFVELAKLRPRIAEAEQRQLQQALKIAELRRRSGLLVQRDKQVHWVAAGTCWAKHQERLVKSYRALQREEFRRRPEKEGSDEGEKEGSDEGEKEGSGEGEKEGSGEGEKEGSGEGEKEGSGEGEKEGSGEGEKEGSGEGEKESSDQGEKEGSDGGQKGGSDESEEEVSEL